MSKIYFVAINWQELDKRHDRNDYRDDYKYVHKWDAGEGTSVSGWTQQFNDSKGWRLYTYTTAKKRDYVSDQALGLTLE